ncbi:hypothetical protein [Bradyrhizobium sp. SZCCHNRI20481]|uniref:hypothetical protein n=1 Tax=Bradyrhizobium sp. SZCCHNRI20481 TaxID=3057286 RepID=UPI002915EDD8|nr:hypothetical protein [Bradyrhizobium sp. SZCCHNRI20481]
MRHFPGKQFEPAKRAIERFAALNRWVTARGGWIVSLPGADPVMIEVLPGSSLIDELEEAGYELTSASEGERIVPGRIVQRFATASNGTFEPLTANSTVPVALTTTHAGITRVMRYWLELSLSDVSAGGI